MKTGIKIFITFLGFLVLCAWNTKKTNDIKKAQWLIGTWENKTQRGSIFETWKKVSDNELIAMSYVLKEKDTMVFENIQLLQQPDGLFYVPKVKNQNQGLPIRFRAKMVSETQLVFENPKHDFPQVISYKRITKDSLVAEISGTKNGQERKILFPMKRRE